jgi:hypothetical protein
MLKKIVTVILCTLFALFLKAQNPEWIVYDCSNLPQSFCNKKILDFTIDKFNNKWIIYEGISIGITKFDDIIWTEYLVPSSVYLNPSWDTYLNPDVAADTNGNIWLIYNTYCTTEILKFSNGLFSTFPGNWYSTKMDIDKNNLIFLNERTFWEPENYGWMKVYNASDFSQVIISCGADGVPHCLANGETWILPIYGNGLIKVVIPSCIGYDSSSTQLPMTKNNDACSCPNDVVYFATDAGLLKHKNNTFMLFDSANSPVIQPVRAVACDLNNNIWLGTDSGLMKIDTLNNYLLVATKDILPFQKIRKIVVDNFNNKWILFDNTGNVLVVYREGGVILNTPENYYSSGNNVEVYPNPTYAECRMRVRAEMGLVSEVKLYDLQGRLMYITETTEPEITIDLSQLPAGVYYCAVSNEKYRETVKVVKM